MAALDAAEDAALSSFGGRDDSTQRPWLAAARSRTPDLHTRWVINLVEKNPKYAVPPPERTPATCTQHTAMAADRGREESGRLSLVRAALSNVQEKVMHTSQRYQQENEQHHHHHSQHHHNDKDGDMLTTTPPPLDIDYGPVSASDKLAHFRLLLGIQNKPSFSRTEVLQRPARNKGIYYRTCHAESRARLQYTVFSILINACLGLQIVVAAALTALGASNGSHKAVTAFGAINTVIAGFLTFLKGSGLPHRLKYYQSEWCKIRETIEQRERDFGLEGCTMDVEYQVGLIVQMYESVKEDIEASTPDNFVSSKKMKGITIEKSHTVGLSATSKEQSVRQPQRPSVTGPPGAAGHPTATGP
jgi:SMODS and SLOG-associating 2TM effector domain